MTRDNLAEAHPGPGADQTPAAHRDHTNGGGPLFAFHCRRADGSPISLEVHELMSDEAALERAQKLLTEHRSCSIVEVFEGDRRVGAVERQER